MTPDERASHAPRSNGPTELEIADWRRRVFELYAEVRRNASSDPEEAHRLWRATRETLYREHPASPVQPSDRAGFRAQHFPYERSLRFEAELVPPPEPAPSRVELPASLPLQSPFARMGAVSLQFPTGTRRLGVFWLNEYSGGLFVPFRDGTSGRETYGAGRYLLDTAKGADLGVTRSGALILDFNFAFQPSCAFDPRWACPLAPPENRLDLEVRAGERIA